MSGNAIRPETGSRPGSQNRETPDRIAVVGRRDLIAGAGAATLVALLLGTGEASRADAAPPPTTFDEAMKAILGTAKPTAARIVFDLPEIAENGNTVPFTLIVDSPMTPADNVKAAHVVSSGNPQPSVASFYFSDLSGRATVTSRMRLAKSQDVIAIAELSDGRFLISTRMIKVTIGGCGG